MRGEVLQFKDSLFMFLPMLLGPSIAGIAMDGLVDGRVGLRDLISRMRLWRVGVGWYAAILIFPVSILLVQLALVSLVTPDFSPYFFPAGIAIGLMAGYFEEIGWTGFALPKMLAKHSALTVGILLGVLHSLWHLAADYVGASAARGVYWLPHFAAFLVSMTATRVLMVWVYTNTGSVLLAQLLHASSTGFLSILVPLSLSPWNDTVFYLAYATVLWAVVAAVAARYGTQLHGGNRVNRP